MTDERELERAVGSVIVPQVRAARTRPGAFTNPDDVRPTRDYLRRFPPAGVVLFGSGSAGAVEVDTLLAGVRADLAQLGHARPFAACELEQGAGQHLLGATRLPPALALAAAAEAGAARAVASAGALTALEARARGVELVLAPVADVDLADALLGVRSFGSAPADAARHAGEFQRGLRLGGALGCARHAASDGSTRERTRGELGAGCAALGDMLDLEAQAGDDDAPARALAAGCDGLLSPRDPEAAAESLLTAVRAGTLAIARLREAAARMLELRARALEAPDPAAIGAAVQSGELERVCLGDAAQRAAWSIELAARALRVSRGGWAWRPGAPCEVLAPLHQARSQEARAAVNRLREGLAGRGRPRGALLPVLVEVGAGLDAAQLAEIDAKQADLRGLGWPVGLVWFGPPRSLPDAWRARREVPVLLAWAATPPLAEATLGFLSGRSQCGGFLDAQGG